MTTGTESTRVQNVPRETPALPWYFQQKFLRACLQTINKAGNDLQDPLSLKPDSTEGVRIKGVLKA